MSGERRPETFPRSLRLRKRRDFTRVQRSGGKVVSNDLVVVHRARGERSVEGPRFGLTVSKKVGNAVVRNRTKRRLREAIRRVYARDDGLSGTDVVFIARPSAARASGADLFLQVESALSRIRSNRGQGRGARGNRSREAR
ncbi:MAG: ribonuclease P protein component [Myxococcota bacterium]